MTEMTPHPFAGPLTAARCEFLLSPTLMCGQPRAVHPSTAAPDLRRGRRSKRPRETPVYQATTSVPGLDVYVDREGVVVLHVEMNGGYPVRNLDTFVAELEVARRHAKQYVDGHPPEPGPGGR